MTITDRHIVTTLAIALLLLFGAAFGAWLQAENDLALARSALAAVQKERDMLQVAAVLQDIHFDNNCRRFSAGKMKLSVPVTYRKGK